MRLNCAIIFFLFFFFIGIFSLDAQQFISSTQDFTDLKVEKLTVEQIEKIKLELKNKNVVFDQLQSYFYSKGMSENQFNQLANRINETELNKNPILKNSESIKESEIKPRIKEKEVFFRDSLVFGHEIFDNSNFNFEPNQSIATPLEYIVDIGDELQVNIYGTQQFTQNVKVSKEGTINLENIGNIKIGGLEFGALVGLINKKASAIFSTLQNGNSKISISIINYKSIQVTIIGARYPGNYTVSSMSTVFNALHAAGGPGENGSYRKIELIRGGTIFKLVDLYSFLCTGDISKNINLRNGDIIRIPGFINRVTINGELKKTGVFELNSNETFRTLLKYCSGFTENAFTAKVLITRNSNGQKKLITLFEKDFDLFELNSGDVINVDKILFLYENKLSISGAVYRPGNYQYLPGMKLLDLVSLAEGPKEDAYLNWVLLNREAENLEKEVNGINLKDVILDANSKYNIELKKGDHLHISSYFEMKEKQTIEINGEVKNPGFLPYLNKMKLFDAIQLAGGVTETASNLIEISRINRQDSIENSVIFKFTYSKTEPSDSVNFELKPFDMISIRKNKYFNEIKTVILKGEFTKCGVYSIISKNERVLDLVNRADGIKKEGNIKSFRIERTVDIIEENDSNDRDRVMKVEKILVPINFRKILRNKSLLDNCILRDGDILIIDTENEMVKVTGEVELNSEIPFKKFKNAKYYIKSVGGFKPTASKKNIYVIYANGFAKSTTRFLWMNFYPKPERGSNIVVGKKSTFENKIDLNKTIGLSSILTTLTTMSLTVINQLKP